MKIKSVKIVDSKLMISVEIDNGYLTDVVEYEYLSSTQGLPECLNSDSTTNDNIGFLLLSLLSQNPEFKEVCEEFEGLLS